MTQTINRRRFLKLAGASAGTACAASSTQVFASINKKSGGKHKNILYIMSDDHTTQGFGSYGSRLAKLNPTPTLDKLAAEGTLFEQAHCTNAICSPSRAAILTGQYGHVKPRHAPCRAPARAS